MKNDFTIILAPDSFKESMTAKEVCQAMEKGIKNICQDIQCIQVPMADGGEGTMQSLVDATNGKVYYKEVTAPLGNKIRAQYGILGDKQTAVIEMASASGIQLVNKSERNPLILKQLVMLVILCVEKMGQLIYLDLKKEQLKK